MNCEKCQDTNWICEECENGDTLGHQIFCSGPSYLCPHIDQTNLEELNKFLQSGFKQIFCKRDL